MKYSFVRLLQYLLRFKILPSLTEKNCSDSSSFLLFDEDNFAWFTWSRFISSDNATLKMGEDKFEEEKFMKALVNLKDTQESIQVRQ